MCVRKTDGEADSWRFITNSATSHDSCKAACAMVDSCVGVEFGENGYGDKSCYLVEADPASEYKGNNYGNSCWLKTTTNGVAAFTQEVGMCALQTDNL